ncbi:MAG: hypothetical protein LBT45_01335 [Rickettsiales bacterium]|jgi:hypothetical protein|nr:hypothetical protein [Rickettsiales bacterium]
MHGQACEADKPHDVGVTADVACPADYADAGQSADGVCPAGQTESAGVITGQTDSRETFTMTCGM